MHPKLEQFCPSPNKLTNRQFVGVTQCLAWIDTQFKKGKTTIRLNVFNELYLKETDQSTFLFDRLYGNDVPTILSYNTAHCVVKTLRELGYFASIRTGNTTYDTPELVIQTTTDYLSEIGGPTEITIA